MGAFQLSLIDDTANEQDPVAQLLPGSLPKRESESARKLIEKLWANSEKSLRASAKSLWDKKHQHYTCESLLVKNLSQRVMVDEDVLQRWRIEGDWPAVEAGSRVRPMGLVGTDYISENDEFKDPLQSFIDNVFVTLRQKCIWDRYCRLQGNLLPEEIRPSDITYALNEAPLCARHFYALFQQEAYAFARYIDDTGLDLRRLSRLKVRVPIRVLITKNARIRNLVLDNAQQVYTNRGISIATLAQRLDMPEFDLWRLGDLYGKWVLPSQQTLNHLIAQSVIKHFC
jgi:hypothetical protein